ADLIPWQLQEIASLEEDLAADDAAWRIGDEAQDAECRDAFAGAGLADQPEHLALHDVEAHIIHRLRNSALGVEIGPQAADGKQRCLARATTGNFQRNNVRGHNSDVLLRAFVP